METLGDKAIMEALGGETTRGETSGGGTTCGETAGVKGDLTGESTCFGEAARLETIRTGGSGVEFPSGADAVSVSASESVSFVSVSFPPTRGAGWISASKRARSLGVEYRSGSCEARRRTPASKSPKRPDVSGSNDGASTMGEHPVTLLPRYVTVAEQGGFHGGSR